MRLKKGTLQSIKEETDITINLLSDYIARRKFPGRERTYVLEQACKKLGLDVPKELWMFGSRDELKAALSNIN